MAIEVPSEWEWTRIGDHFQRVTRKNKAGVSRVLTASGEHGLIDQEEFFNKRVAAKNLNGYFHLKRGEFAYNRSSMKGYPFGAIKRLDRYEDGVLSTLCLCISLRPNSGISSDYAAQLFDSGQLDRELRPIARVGARAHGLLNVTPADFMAVSFPLPPIPEQEKIAAILSSVDEAIQATQAVIEQTRRVKEGLLQELLTRGIGHSRFKQTEIGEIPERWEITRLGKIALVFNGKGAKSGGSQVRLFKTKHIYDGPVSSEAPEYQPDDLLEGIPKSAFLQPGDVLTPNMAHSTIGRVSYLKDAQEQALCDGQVMVIRSRDKNVVRSRFLFDFLSAWVGRRQLLGREVGSIFGPARGQTHLYPKDVQSILVPLPRLDEQDEIGESRWLDREVEQQSKWLEQLKTAKAGLLQDLLTGKVRVSV